MPPYLDFQSFLTRDSAYCENALGTLPKGKNPMTTLIYTLRELSPTQTQNMFNQFH